MDIVQFLTQFFYRIRYWLLWGSLIVTALVIYFTQFLPFNYTVNSSLYAGITNSTNLDGTELLNIIVPLTISSILPNPKYIGKSFHPSARHQLGPWR